MALDFPANPIDGQVYGNFYYSSAKSAWRTTTEFNTPSTLKNATVTTTTSSTVPLTIQGTTSQSANLQNWVNSSGTTLSSISSLGALSLATPLTIANGGTSAIDAATARTNLGITPVNIGAANRTANWATSNATAVTVSTTTPTTICSLSITTTGRPVFLNATGDMNPTTAPTNYNVLQIYRDSTPIGKFIFCESTANSINNPWALTTIDAVAAGTYTYTVKAWQGAGTMIYGETGNGQAPQIIAFELF